MDPGNNSIVWQYPAIPDTTLLNGPYDVKEIGDYLGLTLPFDFDEGAGSD
ncbi:MAG: hypothetical protein ABSH53_03400 [Holophaga sp.]